MRDPMALSDALLFLAFASLSVVLLWTVHHERRRLPLVWLFLALSLVIAAIGFVHAMQLASLAFPIATLAMALRFITALTAASAAIALPSFVPKIAALLDRGETAYRNERRFLAACESTNDAFMILESVRNDAGEIVDFEFAFANAHTAALLCTTTESLIGKSLCKEFPINRTGGFFEKYKHVVESGQRIEEEFHIDSANINARWLRYQVRRLDDGVAINCTNIGARKETELKLEKLATFKQSIVASSPFATIVTDLDGTITSFNPAAERMLWFSRDDLIDIRTPLILIDPHELAKRASVLTEELGELILPGMAVLHARPDRGMVEEAEWKFIRVDGSVVDVQLTVSPLTAVDGEFVGLIMVAYDITERKRNDEYISHVAHHDALTGLPTRTLFHDRIEVALTAASRTGKKVALLMIDLDGFKEVNDVMGHHVGDEMLIHVSRLLVDSVRASDTVARMGGDEFVILLDDVNSVHNAESIAAKILRSLQQPFRIGTHMLTASASLGICICPESGGTVESLLNNADTAMYRAKAEGKNGFQVFTNDMESESSRRRQLGVGLRHAVRLCELDLVYQPQVCMRTGNVTGVEALLRWTSSTMGLVMPTEFIPIAEESGLIVPIGEWVLRTACREGKKLQIETGMLLTIAVNISPRQFQQENLPLLIAGILQECDLSPSSLELEITENILVNDSAKAMRILKEVRALGVHVAIDDFGTGYSSMTYILRFPVDRIKIDQSFVRNMTLNPASNAVTNAVIALASGLHIKVVAEGVESAAHRDLLASKGCDEAQGYFYSEPIPMAGMRALIGDIGDSPAPLAA
ncbi:MAG TPA: EAL domain-containing protein [Gemmatimonadaceae bacterium]|nr:EAL domain-containing protein [Gemmatimonadaceae bacterium]